MALREEGPVGGLAHLGPQWFAVVMGWCGLGLAWHRAAPALGEVADVVSAVAGGVGLLVFAALVLLSLVRRRRYPEALAEDFRHPVRHAFYAAVPISLMLLGTLALVHGSGPVIARALWLPGVILQFVATVWVLGRWPAGVSGWPAVSPVLFIPIVGNVLVPLAGVPLGHPNLSWAFLAIGALFWPVVVALLLARQAQQPLPERLLPAWFILVAPPAVIGLDAFVFGLGQPVAFAMIGLAAFCLALALRIVLRLPGMPFGMPFWAMSFPLAAFAALVQRTAELEASLWPAGIALLALATAVILWLSLTTIRGLRDRSLLQPEPAAAKAPAAGA
jgi:tellurite resistance protein